jgi:hypothetical protein
MRAVVAALVVKSFRWTECREILKEYLCVMNEWMNKKKLMDSSA